MAYLAQQNTDDDLTEQTGQVQGNNATPTLASGGSFDSEMNSPQAAQQAQPFGALTSYLSSNRTAAQPQQGVNPPLQQRPVNPVQTQPGVNPPLQQRPTQPVQPPNLWNPAPVVKPVAPAPVRPPFNPLPPVSAKPQPIAPGGKYVRPAPVAPKPVVRQPVAPIAKAPAPIARPIQQPVQQPVAPAPIQQPVQQPVAPAPIQQPVAQTPEAEWHKWNNEFGNAIEQWMQQNPDPYVQARQGNPGFNPNDPRTWTDPNFLEKAIAHSKARAALKQSYLKNEPSGRPYTVDFGATPFNTLNSYLSTNRAPVVQQPVMNDPRPGFDGGGW